MGLEKITTLAMLAIFTKVTLANVFKLSGNAVFPARLSFSAICLQIITCKMSGVGNIIIIIFFFVLYCFWLTIGTKIAGMGGKRLKLLRVETIEDGSATKVVQMFQILTIVHFDWYKYVCVTSTQSEVQDGGNYPESRRGKVVQ